MGEPALARACDLLSMTIGTLMSHRAKIGYVDNSPIASVVAEAVEFLAPWPEKLPTTASAAPAGIDPMAIYRAANDVRGWANWLGTTQESWPGLMASVARLCAMVGATPPAAPAFTGLTDQQVYDKFGFLEGVVGARYYKQIAETAIKIQRDALRVNAAAVPEKWIDDPHDIGQGQMLNPEWLRFYGITAQQAHAQQQTPQSVAVPESPADKKGGA